VIPAEARAQRARLFDALEQAADVRLEGRAPGALRGCAAALLFNGAEAPARLPSLKYEQGLALVVGDVELTGDERLDRTLRNAVLAEDRSSPSLEGGSEPVLAFRSGRPVWAIRGLTEVSALQPAELGDEELLRDRLEAGACLSLLPLVHFLRRIQPGWSRPPIRASFLFDDPNLHWPSYGYVKYTDLLRDAEEHGYHAAMAMIPADAWFAHPRAVRLFRSRRDRLSLLVHGNNHVRRELAAPGDDLISALAQAQRRVAALERRSGVRVARVMAPPHGACGEPAMSALLRTGYEALCITRPYPWRDRPPAGAVLAGWRPADLAAGGFPVLPRMPIRSAERELALRAFLGHPLILFGHHDDLADGLGPLRRISAAVNALGEVQWLPLDEIARANFETRWSAETLEIRLYARQATVEIPEGVTSVRVSVPQADGDVVPEALACGDAGTMLSACMTDGWRRSEAMPAESGPVSIQLSRTDAVDPWATARAPWRPRARARRVLAEGRDRLVPLVHAVRGSRRAVL
jgi:hypothetical protein